MAKRKPGKYDAILPNLKPLPPSDLSRQERIQKVIEAVEDKSGIALAQAYADLRVLKDKICDELSEVQLLIDAHEQMLAESQEAQSAGWGDYGVGENTVKLVTGETVRVQPEPVGQVMDKEAFRLWCIKNGYERQLQLWPSTMNAIVKERVLVGLPEPDGCECFSRNKIVFSKNGAE